MYTKQEVDVELAKKANVSDVNSALALNAYTPYVSGQLDLKANKTTTYTQK